MTSISKRGLRPAAPRRAPCMRASSRRRGSSLDRLSSLRPYVAAIAVRISATTTSKTWCKTCCRGAARPLGFPPAGAQAVDRANRRAHPVRRIAGRVYELRICRSTGSDHASLASAKATPAVRAGRPRVEALEHLAEPIARLDHAVREGGDRSTPRSCAPAPRRITSPPARARCSTRGCSREQAAGDGTQSGIRPRRQPVTSEFRTWNRARGAQLVPEVAVAGTARCPPRRWP